MPDVYKTLGQIVAAGSSAWTTLYTVPYPAAVTRGTAEVTPRAAVDSIQTLVTSIIVCNTDGSGQTFGISLEGTAADADPPDPGDPGTVNLLFSGAAIATKETLVLSLGLTLAPGDYVKANASDAGVVFTAMGIETT